MSLSTLNPQQKEAVEHRQGPLLILAGAGSGKTRVVTERIAHLLEQGVEPQQILGVTFTNKAADEMKARVSALVQNHCKGKGAGGSVFLSTFHRLGVFILRQSIALLDYRSDFTIYDQDDSLKLLSSSISQVVGKEGTKSHPAKAIRHLISDCKNRLLSDKEMEKASLQEYRPEVIAAIYAHYQTQLKSANALDFDDLLFLTAKVLQQFPECCSHYQERWRYLLVDEYQDTNHAQYLIAKLLTGASHNFFAVGDPDQSIYSWRGANIRNILSFEADFPNAKVVRLEQNYRSQTHILQASNALIQRNQQRYEKKLWSNLGEGEKIGLFLGEDEIDEADFVLEQLKRHRKRGIPWKEMVLFYRTNVQSRHFEDHLISENIPYIIVGGLSFYQRREVKDILAFLKVAILKWDVVSFLRSVNLPKRGLGPTSLEKMVALSHLNNVAIADLCLQIQRDPTAAPFLKSKQLQGLREYVRLLSLLEQKAKTGDIASCIACAIEESGYERVLQADPQSYEERRNNLYELVVKGEEWQNQSEKNPSIIAFLEEMALRSDFDDAAKGKDRLSLMTLHNGKGLEFKVTFLVGMEEDLFPHIHCKNTPHQLEEERRLCYVGMTRAKENLYLSAVCQRHLWGQYRSMRPSRFLKEIPSDRLEMI